jgi:uncharacterized protein
MRYQPFGKLDFDVSVLGFGAMRLPTVNNDYGVIDEPAAGRLIDQAIDLGINYFDTAYGYHRGMSETFLGKALKGDKRRKVKLATKLPCWQAREYADFDKLLNEQLERLQTDHVEFYLFHSLMNRFWPTVRDMGILEWAEKAKQDGRIGHIGFSFHDKFDVFKSIIDDYAGWEFCQIQYNYMDIENQAGTRGLRYAAEKGIPVIVMEPVLGGNLVKPPPHVSPVLKEAPVQRTLADWAFQWLWNQPEVTMVLSGMSTPDQLEENVQSAVISGVGSLTKAELDFIDRLREAYLDVKPIPCTQCEYCMPCPHDVKIPENIAMYNDGVIFGNIEQAKRFYNHFQKKETSAGACIKCMECVTKCPQKIPIPDWMERIHKALYIEPETE